MDFVPIEDFGGPDTVKALVDDTVQVADIYTTSPALVAEDLVVLEDPENLISAQNIIPLVAERPTPTSSPRCSTRSRPSSPPRT